MLAGQGTASTRWRTAWSADLEHSENQPIGHRSEAAAWLARSARQLRAAFSFSASAKVRRRVLARLTLAATALSLLLGGGVLVYELETVDQVLLARAREETELFTAVAAAHLRSHAAVERAQVDRHLAEFADRRHSTGHGRFLRVEVYDFDHRRVASHVSAQAKRIERRFPAGGLPFAARDGPNHATLMADGTIYLRLMLPMRDTDGALLGYFEGLYQANTDIVREIATRVLTTAGLVVLSVLATTVLLYPLVIGMHRELLRSSRELLHANLQGLEVVGSAIAKRDSDTHRHNYRVVLYAVKLAEAVGLDGDAIRHLIKGAFLHDVGKIAISDLILMKPGKLDADEFATMQTHVEHGVDIVSRSAWLAEAADVVHFHHEKFDGSGYPDGLAGKAIPMTARIFAIADVFDALTSERPYKEAFSIEKTRWILEEGRGQHFDPELIDAFLPLAPALYERYAGREDASVDRATADLVNSYFDLRRHPDPAPPTHTPDERAQPTALGHA